MIKSLKSFLPASAVVTEKKKEKIGLPLFLFVLTIITTLFAGAFLVGANPLQHPWDMTRGISFSFTLMLILLSHELGHYLAARYYGVDASLPYFIPAPPYLFLLGTFGAFIRMRSPILYKNALFDIAVAGPIAGFVLSCAALAVGIPLSEVINRPPEPHDLSIGSSPIFYFFVNQLIGSLPQGYGIDFHPIAFAGWLGLFVTSLNLLPIGQLDGGHLIYALAGRRHRLISILTVILLIVIGFLGWPGWWIWGLLGAFIGLRHPPLADQEIRLNKTRIFIGWASLFIFIGTFIPVPFS
ncbi:MAG: site-2 protease family protein [Nitrospirae bacterium]|nr:site-2 protease family protein [Nitrospirota bacterium]MBI3351575.1 site-2 protease family protein [Nitrospirota bacterium]